MSAESQEVIAPAPRLAGRAMLAAGNKAVYPGQGPCRIVRVVNKVIDGGAIMFYQLTVLDDSGGELFIPVAKAHAIGIRSLMKKSEIPALMDHLKKRAKAAENWKQRANDNARLLNSGGPLDLAEIVASLTELNETRSLTLGEARTLGKARKLLVCEISEVIGEEKEAVDQTVEQTLKSRKR